MVASFVLTSCHFATSDNGDLDGLWQGMYKEDIATGTVTDMRDYNATWAFQGGMVQMNTIGIPASHVIGAFTKTDNCLKIERLSYFTHGKGDTPIEDFAVLSVFGISQNSETFRIVELNDDALRVESSQVRLSFRKY